MQLIKKLINYFQASFSLWICFLAFSLKSFSRSRSPLKINKDESLGRSLFSGNYDPKKEEIDVRAFLVKDPSKGISVNRLTYAPRGPIDLLSKLDALCRTANRNKAYSKANSNKPYSKQKDIKFYGYAVIKADVIQAKKFDEIKSLEVAGTLQCKNPFHGNIRLPENKSKDFYLEVADKLEQISALEKCL